MKRIAVAISLLTATVAGMSAQAPTSIGKASYTESPPSHKAKENNGQVTKVLEKQLWIDERENEAIPTNDWWTSAIANQYSGAMWSYPTMVSTDKNGIRVAYPSYWYDDGTEMKYKSYMTVTGEDFTPAETRAVDWHDWDVTMKCPATEGNGYIMFTQARGVPFTWFEYSAVKPEITFNKEFKLSEKSDGLLIELEGDAYALYLPAGFGYSVNGKTLTLSQAAWMSVGLLPKEGTADSNYSNYSDYALNKVVGTELTWNYDETNSLVRTGWKVSTMNLATGATGGQTLQGFIPHVWKHMTTDSPLRSKLNGKKYLTPRGLLKMAVSSDNTFEYNYKFYGMLPYYARPESGNLTGNNAEDDFNPEIMKELMQTYADKGTFGGDTYWGAKGLTQMALNMSFAKEMGESEIYEQSKQKLKDILVDWLTYTPGEKEHFFSYYPRWGGMVGFEYSFGSEEFNDHHFHYGYFMYAAALLAMEDKEFAEEYGGLLKMIGKDYANWDRKDKRFPFLRNLDLWEGHSWAGGFGDADNENGNGQESSSEAMQGWGGLYLLGVALNDKEMRDAGIFGWMTESRATKEYWFDVDHIGDNSHTTQYNPEKWNFDYTKYNKPYNSNITGKGIGWWTWFAGGIWMHAIQWMPQSPILNYLSEDGGKFAKWDFDTMWKTCDVDWWEKRGDTAALATESLGNVALSYMQRGNAASAAGIFRRAWNEGLGMAKNADTGHITYFSLHNHLTYGEIDTNVSASIPTANKFIKNGKATYQVFNPGESEVTVTFTDGKKVRAIPGMTVFSQDAVPSKLELTSSTDGYVAPGKTGKISVKCLDQYGATATPAGNYEWSVDGGASIRGNDDNAVLSIPSSTAAGSEITVTVTNGTLTGSIVIIANDEPVAKSRTIDGLADKAETGYAAKMKFNVTDQYGTVTAADAVWTVTTPEGSAVSLTKPEYTFEKPGKYSVKAVSRKDGSISAEKSVIILADLPDIVAGNKVVKVYTSSKTKDKDYLIDGSVQTRWQADNGDTGEWVMLDLGKDYDLTSAVINWEAAFAKDYDLAVAPSSAALSGYVSSGNADDCDKIVDSNAWTVVNAVRGLDKAGVTKNQLAASGRFVRLKCVTRQMEYGMSIFEIGVHAIPANIDENRVVSISVGLEDNPSRMEQGTTVKLLPKSVKLNGTLTALGANDIEWSCDSVAEFSGNIFKALRPGMNTITATLKSDKTVQGTASIFVDEIALPDALTAQPWRFTAEQGETMDIEIGCKTQLGGIWKDLSGFNYSFTVTEEGQEVPAGTVNFNPETGTFSSNNPGKYTIMLKATASGTPVPVEIDEVKIVAHVVAQSEINFALGKKSWATSTNGNDDSSKAFDGDNTTRWQALNDGFKKGEENVQDLGVDLGANFLVKKFVVKWEAANATDYEIQVSSDKQKWTTLHRRAAFVHNIAYTDTHTMDQAVSARYVRLHCTRPSMDYGYSVYELEVYGEGKGDSPAPTELNGNCTHDPEVISVKKNLALRKAVGSPYSKDRDSATIGNKGLVDGVNNKDHSWESVHAAEHVHVTVDLEKVYAVDEVRIFWERSFARDFRLEYSQDGETWYVGRSVNGWDGVSEEAGQPDHTYILTFGKGPKQARYIRVKCDKHDILEEMYKYGFRINELEVYGEEVENYTTPFDPVDDGKDEPRCNLAMGKPVSATDVKNNYKATDANDGNLGTVWESSDGVDNVSLTVDLKSHYKLDEVNLTWGTPYAKAYELQVSNSDEDNGTAVWETIKTESGLSDQGNKQVVVDLNEKEARFIRFVGKERGTVWGYGIKEIEAYGSGNEWTDAWDSQDPENPDNPDPENPDTDNLAFRKPIEASSTTTNAVGYEAKNIVDGNMDTRWESKTGDNPVSVIVDLGKAYDVDKVNVNWEVRRAKSFNIEYSYDGDRWFIAQKVSDIDALGIENVNNHYDYVKEFDSPKAARYIRIACNIPAQQACYSIWELMVYGNLNTTGESVNNDPEIFADGTESYPDFKPEDNIALGKRAWASSEYNNNNIASNAIDGNLGTGWESDYSDPQWIIIDLKGYFNVNQIKIFWEAAYAKKYTVEYLYAQNVPGMQNVASENGRSLVGQAPAHGEWQKAFDRDDDSHLKDAENGTKLDDYNTTQPFPARFIRITGKERATVYGYHVKEVQVFANNTVTVGVDDIIDIDSEYADVYTLNGILIKRNVHRDSIREGLVSGFYIIRSGNKSEKIRI